MRAPDKINNPAATSDIDVIWKNSGVRKSFINRRQGGDPFAKSPQLQV
jgi:hypothetical protein